MNERGSNRPPDPPSDWFGFVVGLVLIIGLVAYAYCTSKPEPVPKPSRTASVEPLARTDHGTPRGFAARWTAATSQPGFAGVAPDR